MIKFLLLLWMSTFRKKLVKKGKIMAKKRTNAAKVDSGTLLEDLVMVDASDGTTGVTADGTGDTPPPPPGESAAVTTTTPPPGDAAMDTTAPPGAAAMDTTAPPAPPGDSNLVNTNATLVAAGTAAPPADIATVETSKRQTKN
jgi:hypothetical protein